MANQNNLFVPLALVGIGVYAVSKFKNTFSDFATDFKDTTTSILKKYDMKNEVVDVKEKDDGSTSYLYEAGKEAGATHEDFDVKISPTANIIEYKGLKMAAVDDTTIAFLDATGEELPIPRYKTDVTNIDLQGAYDWLGSNTKVHSATSIISKPKKSSSSSSSGITQTKTTSGTKTTYGVNVPTGTYKTAGGGSISILRREDNPNSKYYTGGK